MLLLAPAIALGQQAAAPLTLQSALDRAIQANPRLVALRLRRSVNIASRDVAAERLNPEFRAEFAKETPKEGYTLAIPWETAGKRAKRIAVGEAVVSTGDAELAQTTADVRADVRHAFVARFAADSRRAVLDEMQELARRARDAAQARFDAGEAPRLEVLQAELALADAENQAGAARGAVEAARVSLNALLGFPLDAPTPIDMEVNVGPSVGVAAAVERARTANTELALLERRFAEQRTRIALARALRQPDITPEATLTRRAEPEFTNGWRAAVAITVPILTTHAAGVRVEEAALAQLASERDATLARVTSEVAAAAATADAQRTQYLRYRDEIVPQALEVERMAEDSYTLGQTGIAAYLQSLQATRDVRLRALASAADLQNALAELERTIGAPVATVP